MATSETHSASNSIVVMKFGGTSVATEASRKQVVARISAELQCGSKPVVVVSAMGRRGDAYATDSLLSLVDTAQINAHETDLLMSTGEIISCVVLVSLLNAQGISARALTGADAGIVTDSTPGQATIRHIDTAAINTVLNAGKVAVVAGFQGADSEGMLHTLGRGGSDTSACALGVALGAIRVDIYTDVDGVFTADPRVIQEAQLIDTITADELYQMAKHGSKVVHAPAAELAIQSGVRMRVRNTFSTGEGTEVVSLDDFRPDKVATAVATVADIARLRVRLPYVKDDSKAHMDVQTKVYGLMSAAGISIDMFTPMNDRLVFSVEENLAEKAQNVLTYEGLEVAVRQKLGKVTVIGSGMHGVPGVMAKIAQTLSEAGIDILQVSDSHATISLLVDESDLVLAAQVLHRAFDLQELPH